MPTHQHARATVGQAIGTVLGAGQGVVGRMMRGNRWRALPKQPKKIATPGPLPEEPMQLKGPSSQGRQDVTEYANHGIAAKVRAHKQELAEHTSAMERLGVEGTRIPESEAAPFAIPRGKRSRSQRREAEAAIQMTLQRKSLGGILEFAKSKKKKIKVKEGALHKQAHIKQGEKIGKERLTQMKHSKNAKMRKRANFALNFAYGKSMGIIDYMKKSVGGIREFMKSLPITGIVDYLEKGGRGKKTRTLKTAKRIRTARLSSKTYRQTAPAVKRAQKAKLHGKPPKAAKRPKGSGIGKSRRHPIDTRFDRNLQDRGPDYDWAENEEMYETPHVPERARGYYERRKKGGRRPPTAQRRVEFDPKDMI